MGAGGNQYEMNLRRNRAINRFGISLLLIYNAERCVGLSCKFSSERRDLTGAPLGQCDGWRSSSIMILFEVHRAATAWTQEFPSVFRVEHDFLLLYEIFVHAGGQSSRTKT